MSISKKGNLFIGTSGFYYDHWIGRFYPENLSKSKWLTFFSDKFSSVEINSSFYHLPKEKTLSSWYKKTSKGFKFSLKASKYITHTRKLKNVDDELQRFIILTHILKEKLGIVLFQLPGSLKYDVELLKDFIVLLPEGERYAIEFRDSSWFREDVYDLLNAHDIALCNISSPKMRELFEVTASFLYIRFHGVKKWYDYNYTEEDLLPWVLFIKQNLDRGRDVYAYFNNDTSGYAIENGYLLKKLIEEGNDG